MIQHYVNYYSLSWKQALPFVLPSRETKSMWRLWVPLSSWMFVALSFQLQSYLISSQLINAKAVKGGLARCTRVTKDIIQQKDHGIPQWQGLISNKGYIKNHDCLPSKTSTSLQLSKLDERNLEPRNEEETNSFKLWKDCQNNTEDRGKVKDLLNSTFKGNQATQCGKMQESNTRQACQRTHTSSTPA